MFKWFKKKRKIDTDDMVVAIPKPVLDKLTEIAGTCELYIRELNSPVPDPNLKAQYKKHLEKLFFGDKDE